jgi:hypothetical protein
MGLMDLHIRIMAIQELRFSSSLVSSKFLTYIKDSFHFLRSKMLKPQTVTLLTSVQKLTRQNKTVPAVSLFFAKYIILKTS